MAQDNGNTSLEMGTSDQVLVATKRKRTLTYVIGFAVMLAAIAVVVTLVVVLSGNDGGVAEPIVTTEGPTTPVFTSTTTTVTTTVAPSTELPSTEPPILVPDPAPLDLEEVIDGTFSPASFNGTWTSGSDILFRNANGDLVLYDLETDSTTPLIANTSQILQQASRVTQLSPDGNHVVLSYNIAPIYRYSFLARYAVVNTQTGDVVDVVPPGLNAEESFLQNFQWGPSGTSFAFVYLNNIYYQQSLTSQPQQITTTGNLTVIYNGIPDWVYEEEVFSSSNAIWFSKDGRNMAYVTFNDQDVRIMKIPHYGTPGSVAYQYTQHREIRYPKVGTTNPTVTVSLRDLTLGNTTIFTVPADLDQPILKTVRFVNNATVALVWTNRVQTTLRVVVCSGTEACSQIFTYSEPNGWIDNAPFIFNDEGTAFVTILPQSVNGISYKQIVRVSQSGTTWTSSNAVNIAHTVLDILTWSSDGVIWYKATSISDSAEQHIYSITSTGIVSCFTCDIRRPDGGECLYNEATVSNRGDLITINCAGPDVPQVYVYSTNGSLIRVWDDASDLVEATSNRVLPSLVRMSVPLGAGTAMADVHLQVPANYQNQSLPLLVFVYAGPDTALVTKQWNLDWGSSLVSRWNITVAHIDGRGSGLRGVSNLFAVNRRLGTLEVEDQINVTRYLQNNLPWIDSNRTCIWGWSYGGYAATKALAEGGDVFRCAAAVAPVVDWKFYDTIYTERYMDLPTTNAEAYATSSLLTDQVVEAFRNKSYLLIHGTADDNVHYQQAMVLSRLLQRRDVYFTQMSYTDEDHSLVGVRPHLYHGIEKFLQEYML